MRVSRHSTPWGRNALTDDDRALIAATAPDDIEAIFSRHHRTRVYSCQLNRAGRGITFGDGPTPRDAFVRAVAKVTA